jgi:hypothetical protein
MSESKDWKWEEVEVSADGMISGEELDETLKEVAERQKESWLSPHQGILVHPIGHRNMMVEFENYSKTKANNIVLKMAKEQGFSEEHIAELKENLEK